MAFAAMQIIKKMAIVKTLTKYSLDKKEFSSIEEVKEYVTDKIGLEVLDKIMRVCPPQKHKDIFEMMKVLTSKEVRPVLTKYLNITVKRPIYDSYIEEETINIFDI